MNKTRLVQLGFGDFGKSWFGEVLPFGENTEFVGVVSSSEEKRAWIAQNSCLDQENVVPNLKTALEKVKPEVVLCVTPPAAHLKNVLEAIEVGVTVICEKPIALDCQDAQAMLNTSKRSGVPVIIAENDRYMDIMRCAREIFASGKLGRLDYIKLDFFRCHNMGAVSYHSHMPHPLLLDIGVHHFDCLRYISGLEAVKVKGCDEWDCEWSPYLVSASGAKSTDNVGLIAYNVV